jgi:hypothetical protein
VVAEAQVQEAGGLLAVEAQVEHLSLAQFKQMERLHHRVVLVELVEVIQIVHILDLQIILIVVVQLEEEQAVEALVLLEMDRVVA